MSEVLGLLSWVAGGLLAGLLVRQLVPGPEPAGWAGPLALGLLGALAGGALATLLGFGGVSGFDPRSLVVALLGAVLLLLVGRLLAERSRR